MAESKKPLRSSSNKIKDIYDTYMRNEDRKVEINDFEDDETQAELEQKVEEKLKQESPEPAAIVEEESNEEVEEKENTVDNTDELQEMKDKVLRISAEMENLRRRTSKEKQDLIRYANESLLSKLLELPDDIENAINSGESSSEPTPMLEGIKMIHRKMLKIFEEEGVKAMDDPTGEEFDVDYHEALMSQPSESIAEGHIINIVQKGYLYKEKVLRHAKVITSQGNG